MLWFWHGVNASIAAALVGYYFPGHRSAAIGSGPNRIAGPLGRLRFLALLARLFRIRRFGGRRGLLGCSREPAAAARGTPESAGEHFKRHSNGGPATAAREWQPGSREVTAAHCRAKGFWTQLGLNPVAS